MVCICSLKSTLPSFETSDGLVVTPSSIPRLAASRISLRLAVSKKNFIVPPFRIAVGPRGQVPYYLSRPGMTRVRFLPDHSISPLNSEGQAGSLSYIQTAQGL